MVSAVVLVLQMRKVVQLKKMIVITQNDNEVILDTAKTLVRITVTVCTVYTTVTICLSFRILFDISR